MARRPKKPEDPPPGLPAWMATFSDMVTLLLTFFVMLTAMANFEDVQKVDAVFKSIRDALGVGGFDISLVDADDDALTSKDLRQQSVQPIVARLRQALSRHISDDLARVQTGPNEVRVRLDERVFFKPGSALLHPAAYALISDVAEAISGQDVAVAVEGYADGQGDEAHNWALSADRALAVVLALRAKGPVAGDQIEAVAMGPFHGNDQAGEGWNRRIELVFRTTTPNGRAVLENLAGGVNARP